MEMKSLQFPLVHPGSTGRPIHFILSTLISVCLHHMLKNKFSYPTSINSHESQVNTLNFAISICKHEDILRGYDTITSLIQSFQASKLKGSICIFIFVSLKLSEDSIRNKINSLLAKYPSELQSKIEVKILPAVYPPYIPISQWVNPTGSYCSCSNIRYFLPVILSDIEHVAFLNPGTSVTIELSSLWKKADRVQSAMNEEAKMISKRYNRRNNGKLIYHPPRQFPGALILMDLSKIRASKWQETLVYCPKTSSKVIKRCVWMTCLISKTSDQCYFL